MFLDLLSLLSVTILSQWSSRLICRAGYLYTLRAKNIHYLIPS